MPLKSCNLLVPEELDARLLFNQQLVSGLTCVLQSSLSCLIFAELFANRGECTAALACQDGESRIVV